LVFKHSQRDDRDDEPGCVPMKTVTRERSAQSTLLQRVLVPLHVESMNVYEIELARLVTVSIGYSNTEQNLSEELRSYAQA